MSLRNLCRRGPARARFAPLSGAALLAVMAAGCASPEPVAKTFATRNRPVEVEVTEQSAPSAPSSPAYETRPWMVESAPTVRPVAPTSPGIAALTGKTIVVDAGHGGKDPGTKALSPVPEKSIVLAIARDLENRLRAAGADVRMTRSGDSYPELEERAQLAETLSADLLVSIHADSAENSSASGAAVWVARRASDRSRVVARSIDGAFRAAGINARGMREADFKVLATHSRPAVLVECGFLTNASDAKLLNRDDYRANLAAAIASGISGGLTR